MPDSYVTTDTFTMPEQAAWQVVNDRKLRMTAADLREIVTAALDVYEEVRDDA